MRASEHIAACVSHVKAGAPLAAVSDVEATLAMLAPEELNDKTRRLFGFIMSSVGLQAVENGDPSVEARESAAALDPSYENLLTLARATWAEDRDQGRVEMALRRAAAVAVPGEWKAHERLGNILFRREDYAGAAPILRAAAALSLGEAPPEVYYQLGMTLVELPEDAELVSKEAENALRMAVKLVDPVAAAQQKRTKSVFLPKDRTLEAEVMSTPPTPL